MSLELVVVANNCNPDMSPGPRSTYMVAGNEADGKFSCTNKPSDLIFTRTGQVGLIFKGKSGVVHNNCFKIKPNEKLVNKDYIYYFFKQESIYKLINSTK